MIRASMVFLVALAISASLAGHHHHGSIQNPFVKNRQVVELRDQGKAVELIDEPVFDEELMEEPIDEQELELRTTECVDAYPKGWKGICISCKEYALRGLCDENWSESKHCLSSKPSGKVEDTCKQSCGTCVCKWVDGDGNSDDEDYIGETRTRGECISRVQSEHPNANGATWGVMQGSRHMECYAEYRMTGSDNASGKWISCKIGQCVGKMTDNDSYCSSKNSDSHSCDSHSWCKWTEGRCPKTNPFVTTGGDFCVSFDGAGIPCPEKRCAHYKE